MILHSFSNTFMIWSIRPPGEASPGCGARPGDNAPMCFTCRCAVSQALVTTCEMYCNDVDMQNCRKKSNKALSSYTFLECQLPTDLSSKTLARSRGPAGVRTKLASERSSGHPQWAALELPLKVIEVPYYVIRTPMILWAYNSISFFHWPLTAGPFSDSVQVCM